MDREVPRSSASLAETYVAARRSIHRTCFGRMGAVFLERQVTAARTFHAF
jgi:hypothetical protein